MIETAEAHLYMMKIFVNAVKSGLIQESEPVVKLDPLHDGLLDIGVLLISLATCITELAYKVFDISTLVDVCLTSLLSTSRIRKQSVHVDNPTVWLSQRRTIQG